MHVSIMVLKMATGTHVLFWAYSGYNYYNLLSFIRCVHKGKPRSSQSAQSKVLHA